MTSTELKALDESCRSCEHRIGTTCPLTHSTGVGRGTTCPRQSASLKAVVVRIRLKNRVGGWRTMGDGDGWMCLEHVQGVIALMECHDEWLIRVYPTCKTGRCVYCGEEAKRRTNAIAPLELIPSTVEG